MDNVKQFNILGSIQDKELEPRQKVVPVKAGYIRISATRTSAVIRWKAGGCIITNGALVARVKGHKLMMKPGSSGKRISWIRSAWGDELIDLREGDSIGNFNILEGLSKDELVSLKAAIDNKLGGKDNE